MAKLTQRMDAVKIEIPPDIAERLDRYAAELGKEYLFPVTRQQAFERFSRKFLVQTEEADHGR